MLDLSDGQRLNGWRAQTSNLSMNAGLLRFKDLIGCDLAGHLTASQCGEETPKLASEARVDNGLGQASWRHLVLLGAPPI